MDPDLISSTIALDDNDPEKERLLRQYKMSQGLLQQGLQGPQTQSNGRVVTAPTALGALGSIAQSVGGAYMGRQAETGLQGVADRQRDARAKYFTALASTLRRNSQPQQPGAPASPPGAVTNPDDFDYGT